MISPWWNIKWLFALSTPVLILYSMTANEIYVKRELSTETLIYFTLIAVKVKR